MVEISRRLGEDEAVTTESVKAPRLYRLKVIDGRGGSYVVVGPRSDLVRAMDWLESTVAGTAWFRLTGLDAGRKPVTILIGREDVCGMILESV